MKFSTRPLELIGTLVIVIAMRARTVLQWRKAAFLCLVLALPTFVVNKEAGRFVSVLGLIYLAVSVIVTMVHMWHMERRFKARMHRTS